MKIYKPNPDTDIRVGAVLILCGVAHKETGQPAWAIPCGTFTTSKREATRIAGLIYNMRRSGK